MPFVKAFGSLVRRRPFLVQRLEEVLKKLLTSLEFFDEDGRKKIAIGAHSRRGMLVECVARLLAQAVFVTMCGSCKGKSGACAGVYTINTARAAFTRCNSVVAG